MNFKQFNLTQFLDVKQSSWTFIPSPPAKGTIYSRSIFFSSSPSSWWWRLHLRILGGNGKPRSTGWVNDRPNSTKAGFHQLRVALQRLKNSWEKRFQQLQSDGVKGGRERKIRGFFGSFRRSFQGVETQIGTHSNPNHWFGAWWGIILSYLVRWFWWFQENVSKSLMHFVGETCFIGLQYIFFVGTYPLKLVIQFTIVLQSYRWWLKSCTTWDVWNPINNGNNYLSTG